MAAESSKSRLVKNESMARVTTRMPDWMIDSLDDLVEDGEVPNRAEPVRQGVTLELARRDRLPSIAVDETWKYYSNHYTATGSTRDVFHFTDDCERIRDDSNVVDRDKSYLQFHEPDPCECCHDLNGVNR